MLATITWQVLTSSLSLFWADPGLPDSAASLSDWISGLGLFSGVQPTHMLTGPLMVFCTSLWPPRKTTSMLKGSVAVSWKMATLDLAAAVLGS